jgi:hypothetical protein
MLQQLFDETCTAGCAMHRGTHSGRDREVLHRAVPRQTTLDQSISRAAQPGGAPGRSVQRTATTGVSVLLPPEVYWVQITGTR